MSLPRSLIQLLIWTGTAALVVFISLPFHGLQHRYWAVMLLFLLGFLLFLLLLARRRSAPLMQPRIDWPLWLCVLCLSAGTVSPMLRDVAVARYFELCATMLLLYHIGKGLSRNAEDRLGVGLAFSICGILVAWYVIGYGIRHLDSSLFLRDVTGIEMYQAFQREYQRAFHPTVVSNFLVLSSAFTLPLIHHQSRLVRRVGQATLSLTVLCVLIPYWRGAVFVFGTMLLVYGGLNRKPYTAFAAAALFGAALFLSLIAPPPVKNTNVRDALVEPRRVIRLQKGWSMFLSSPVMGRGFDQYRRLFDRTPPLPTIPRLQADLSIPDLQVADNMYCTLLAETGLVGCAGFFTLIVVLLWRGWRVLRGTYEDERRASLISGLLLLGGSLLSMLSYETFYWHTPFMLLSLGCGWLAGLAGPCSARAAEVRAASSRLGEEERERVVGCSASSLPASVMAGWLWAAVVLCGVALAAANLSPFRRYPLPPERYDDWGFRNAAVPAQADVVALGDAQTYGRTVARDQAWPQQLARLAGVVTYNMALPGHSPVDGLALLSVTLKLRPRLIVQAFYSGSDCYNAYEAVYHGRGDPWLKTGDSQLLERYSMADQADPLTEKLSKFQWFDQFTMRTRVWGLLKWAAQRQRARYVVVETAQARTILTPAYRLVALDGDDPRIVEGCRIALEATAQAQQRLQERGVGYLVLLIPTKEYVYQDVVPPTERSAVYAELLQHERFMWQQAKAFFARRGMVTVDALPILRASLRHGEPPYYDTPTGHLDATGHRLMAERLFSTIQAQRLLEPRTGVVEGGEGTARGALQ